MHDVEKDHVAGLDDAIGEGVRVRPAARTGNRIDALDALGPQAEQAVVGDGDQLVLARAGPDGAGDIDIGGVDHGGGELEQLDLVGGLDLARVEHRLLSVDDLDAFGLQRAQHRQLHEVDADRLVLDAVMDESLLDLLGEIGLHAEEGRQRPLHGRDRRRDIVLQPRRGDALGRWRGVPKEGRAFDRAERVAHLLVACPFADMGAGDVADIVEIEAQHRAETGMADRLLGALQPVLKQPVVVDAAFPVLGLGAP